MAVYKVQYSSTFSIVYTIICTLYELYTAETAKSSNFEVADSSFFLIMDLCDWFWNPVADYSNL